MPRIEKSVFISYRRTNIPWALNVYQDLTHHGYDVFFDFEGIGSGDFESIIVDNITSRAHFVLILTPSALERCGEPGDWLRREIEVALETKRNIVPIMLEGFSFGTPTIASQLTGSLAPLKFYNGLSIPVEYFPAAMEKLRTSFLNIPLASVMQPTTIVAQQAASTQKTAANLAPPVLEEHLTAQQYFERGVATSNPNEQIRLFSEAIRLKPDWSEAFNYRGHARYAERDTDEALADYDQAIKLQPNYAEPYNNRAIILEARGDLNAALLNYTEAIQFNPHACNLYINRGVLLQKSEPAAAMADFEQYLKLRGASIDANTKAVEKLLSKLRQTLVDSQAADPEIPAVPNTPPVPP